MKFKIILTFIILIIVGGIGLYFINDINEDAILVSKYDRSDNDITENTYEVSIVEKKEINNNLDEEVEAIEENKKEKTTTNNELIKTNTEEKKETQTSKKVNKQTGSEQTVTQKENLVQGTSNKKTNSNTVKKESSKEEKNTQQITEKKKDTNSEKQKEKSIYDYEFNIQEIKSELISIGESLGLKHRTTDEGTEITPNNSSWASPVTGSKEYQGEQLEASLKDYVRSMPEMVSSYGGTEIEFFTIYVEDNGDSYTFYFLY